MKKTRVEIVHKEPYEKCFEILKSMIVEDGELKKYKIDKDTLFNELPEQIVNEFLDFIASYDLYKRQILLKMIKDGTLIIHCWED